MFLMFRVLLLRISPQHLTSLWPIMVTELVKKKIHQWSSLYKEYLFPWLCSNASSVVLNVLSTLVGYSYNIYVEYFRYAFLTALRRHCWMIKKFQSESSFMTKCCLHIFFPSIFMEKQFSVSGVNCGVAMTRMVCCASLRQNWTCTCQPASFWTPLCPSLLSRCLCFKCEIHVNCVYACYSVFTHAILVINYQKQFNFSLLWMFL